MVSLTVPDLPLGAGVDQDGDIVMTSPLPLPSSSDLTTSTSFSPPHSPSPSPSAPARASAFTPGLTCASDSPPPQHPASPRWWDIARVWGRLAGLVTGVFRQVQDPEDDDPRSDTVDAPSSSGDAAASLPLSTPALEHESAESFPLRELVEDGYAPGRVYVGVGGRPRLPIDIKLGKRVRFADDDGIDMNPQSPKRRRKSRAIRKEFGMKTGLLRGPSPPKHTVYQGPSMSYLAEKDAALDAKLPDADKRCSELDLARTNGTSNAQRHGSVGAYSRLGEVLGNFPFSFDDEREREDEFSKMASVLVERRIKREKAEMEAASRRKAEESRARHEMARRRAIITNNPLPLATMFDATIAECSTKPITPRRLDMPPPPPPMPQIEPELTLCTPTSPLLATVDSFLGLPKKSMDLSYSVVPPPPRAVLPPPSGNNISPESLAEAESDGEPASPASPASPPPASANRSSQDRPNQTTPLTAHAPVYLNHPGHKSASVSDQATVTVKAFTKAQILEPPTQIEQSTLIYQSIEITTETETTIQSEDMPQYTAKRTRKRCRSPTMEEGDHTTKGKENEVAPKKARRSLGRVSASPSRVSPSRASPARAIRKSQRSTKSPEADRKMGFLNQPPRRSRRLTPVVQ